MARKVKSLFNPKEEIGKPKKQEQDFADKIGGYASRNSGAYRTSSGPGGSGFNPDGSSKEYAYEAKQTDCESLSITLDWLEKISIGAQQKRKKPLLHLQFNNASNICEKKWVMMEESEVLRLISDSKDKG